MKKLCILNNDLARGGTDTFVVNLVKNINREEFDITVILSVDEGTKTLRENELIEAGIRVKKTATITGRGLKGRYQHLKKLYTILKKEKCDIFQTNIDLFNGVNLLVAWMAGVPVRVCHSHNSEQGRELREGRTWKIRVYQRVMRWLCWKFSTKRCGCSELAMDFLFTNHWRNDLNSRVVHNGIDLNEYTIDFDKNEKKKSLGVKNKFNIVTVGRMAFQKNPMFIVEIINELYKIRDDCDFIWVGSGDMEKEVKKKIDEYKIQEKMHLLGLRTDVSEILRISDLFLLPSWFEGLAIVLIEAQAAKLPCVISDTISEESDCGGCLYTSLQKPASYWAKLISDILDKKIDLSVNEQLLQRYGINNMVKEMEEVFLND